MLSSPHSRREIETPEVPFNALYIDHHFVGSLAYWLVEPCRRQLYSRLARTLRHLVHLPDGHRPRCGLVERQS